MTIKFRSHYQRYLAATLAVGSTFMFAAPIVATPAGTQIKNTATATYEDDLGTTFDATSNEVTVTVQEVAGLFVTSLSTIDVNGGSVLPNDAVNFEFKVTNGGNDTTAVNLPKDATIVGPATQDAAKNIQITGFIDPQGNRTTFPTPIDVTANAATDTLVMPAITEGANTYPAGVLPTGYAYIVTVPVKVDALASSGANITVQLGDTGANDNTPATQNQSANSGTNDVSTKDAADGGTGESNGVVGQEKEASASASLTVGSEAIALATILKTHSTPTNNNGTPSVLSDDQITYNLALRVESNPPAGSVGITAGKLVGTAINLNGGMVNRVLLADAIPAQTAYVPNTAVATNANWTPVYTDTATTTPANQATWTTTVPANVTRIGFVYDATTTPINEGDLVNGFSFTVVTSGITGTAPTNITNLAQVFGQTQGNEGPTAPLIYDESGDQSPTNFNENGTPGPTSTLTPGSTTIPNGVSNPTNNGVDNNNDNTGTGPGGEDNVVTISAPGQVLNGPSSAPSAVGPNDNNDDFTNRGALVPPNTPPGSTIDPAEVQFTNTIANPASLLPDQSLVGTRCRELHGEPW
ncbi:MAG: hypothetical protein HC805_07685 [Alkalinema sp. RL_2_19]|nr:hypothetical protein [Alkalinema sp. RL_2_19]